MAAYGKKIVYLSYMENGDKIRNAGFVKVVSEKSGCSVDMHISGMGEAADGKYDVCIVGFDGRERIFGKVHVHRGKGEWKAYYPGGLCKENDNSGQSIEKSVMEYEDIEWFRVKISGSKWLEGNSGNVKKGDISQMQGKYTEEVDKKRQGEERRKAFDRTVREEPKEAEKKSELKAGWMAEDKLPKEAEDYMWGKHADDKECREKTRFSEKNGIDMENIILNDKWEQLCQIYPVIHPYEDDREYISIQPKDFVIMTGDYQHLANNSFLLHGFYNYRHIILGNEKEAGGFYLGVPGVYYEREKMVALMFGFEAFDCSGGKAEAGKFGYYLRKVKI